MHTMFGPQASSLSRTGTTLLLMLMVAMLFSVQLTYNTSMASDGFGVRPKNRTYYNNLTGGGQSMLRHSFVTPAEGLGITDRSVPLPGIPHPEDHSGIVSVSFIVPDCVSDAEFAKIEKCCAPYVKPTAKEMCDYWIEVSQCTLDGVCADCPKEQVNKMTVSILGLFEEFNVCERLEKSFSCSHKMVGIILGVVGGVIAVIVVIGVVICVVCCCCMGGGGFGGRNNQKSSKRNSNRGSKLRKASSKHRASSRASSRY